MGVPKFYRWISERYPCLSQVLKEHQVSRERGAAACQGPFSACRVVLSGPSAGRGTAPGPGRAEPALGPALRGTGRLEAGESGGMAVCGRWGAGEAFGAPPKAFVSDPRPP